LLITDNNEGGVGASERSPPETKSSRVGREVLLSMQVFLQDLEYKMGPLGSISNEFLKCISFL